MKCLTCPRPRALSGRSPLCAVCRVGTKQPRLTYRKPSSFERGVETKRLARKEAA